MQKRLIASILFGLSSAATAFADSNPLVVELQTNLGTIAIKPDYPKAPSSSANFIEYVNNGFYQDTLIHRVVKDFVLQGGGVDRATAQFKQTLSPIVNESTNGLSNLTGTVAMARTSNPNSATSQFYINLVDNPLLDYQSEASPGYAVFGKVVKGMPVANKIEALPAYSSLPYTLDGQVVFIEAVYPNATWNNKNSTTRIRLSGQGRVASTPDGIDCGTDCSLTQSRGELIKLTATPDKNHAFIGWRGDCSGTRRILNLDTKTGNHNCTAVFAPLGATKQ